MAIQSNYHKEMQVGKELVKSAVALFGRQGYDFEDAYKGKTMPECLQESYVAMAPGRSIVNPVTGRENRMPHVYFKALFGDIREEIEDSKLLELIISVFTDSDKVATELVGILDRKLNDDGLPDWDVATDVYRHTYEDSQELRKFFDAGYKRKANGKKSKQKLDTGSIPIVEGIYLEDDDKGKIVPARGIPAVIGDDIGDYEVVPEDRYAAHGTHMRLLPVSEKLAELYPVVSQISLVSRMTYAGKDLGKKRRDGLIKLASTDIDALIHLLFKSIS